MNATLGENITPSRTGLMPNQSELVSLAWATAVGKQIVRSAGFWGSIQVPLTITPQKSYVNEYTASGWATLPFEAYGTIIPPAIFAVVQYGSTIVYKDCYLGAVGYVNLIVKFHTWISDLKVLTKIEDGTTLGAWTFKINHYSNLFNPSWVPVTLESAPVRVAIAGIEEFQDGWLPPGTAALTLNDTVNPTVTLHWYTMGFNPNLSF